MVALGALLTLGGDRGDRPLLAALARRANQLRRLRRKYSNINEAANSIAI
jgi:hypothetical protein